MTLQDARTTRVTRRIAAPRAAIYGALLDAQALARWLPPDGMRGLLHVLEPHVGGRLSMTLTYEDPATGPGGKTTKETDAFSARIAELVPERRIVWEVRFESGDASMAGTMRVAWELADAHGGTEVTNVCSEIPVGIRLEDNKLGVASSLQNLASYLEGEAA